MFSLFSASAASHGRAKQLFKTHPGGQGKLANKQFEFGSGRDSGLRLAPVAFDQTLNTKPQSPNLAQIVLL